MISLIWCTIQCLLIAITFKRLGKYFFNDMWPPVTSLRRKLPAILSKHCMRISFISTWAQTFCYNLYGKSGNSGEYLSWTTHSGGMFSVKIKRFSCRGITFLPLSREQPKFSLPFVWLVNHVSLPRNVICFDYQCQASSREKAKN